MTQEVFKYKMYRAFVDQNCSAALYTALIHRYDIMSHDEWYNFFQRIDNVEQQAKKHHFERFWHIHFAITFNPN